MSVLAAVVLVCYACSSLVLLGFAFHRFWMIYAARSLDAFAAPVEPLARDTPVVTVQLPMYNEREVAERVILAAGAIRYPRDRFEVQVLDDSTDGVARDRVDSAVAELVSRGVDAKVVRRSERVGFKAGALRHGTGLAKGSLLAIFDADFVPPPEFLERTVSLFRTDPRLAVVQGRWTHLNERACWLTRAQGLFLDAHFLVQHIARSACGAWINFNGTAGVWRREAIDDAGGWQHTTLTEDLDLSFRASRRGWAIRFLPDLRCPAELPPTVAAFKGQQHRWTKGTMQVCMNQLVTIVRSDAPRQAKFEAVFHLGSPVVHVLLLAIMVLMAPALWASEHLETVFRPSAGGVTAMSVASVGLFVALTSMCLYLATGQRSKPARWRSLALGVVGTPLALAVAAGLALTNTRAMLEACARRDTPFIRTPKFGDADHPPRGARRLVASLIRLPAFETLLALYLLASLAWTVTQPGWFVATPLLFVFTLGCAAMAIRQAIESGGLAASPST